MEPAFRFSVPLRVRFNETDAQAHVNFAWYFNYFDVGLIEYLRSLGYSYQAMVAEGLDMFYVDAHASYHTPAYFDEQIRVHCRLGHIGNTSMRFDFQVISQADDRRMATGEITVVIVEHGTGAKRPVPEVLRRAVAEFERSGGNGLVEVGT